MAEKGETLRLLPACHGAWGAPDVSIAGQGLTCSLKDLLFETKYAAQIFDWQNAVFLLFMPLLLALATFTFRALFGSSGTVKLDDVFKNAGDMQKMYRDWTTLGSQGRELSAEMRMVVIHTSSHPTDVDPRNVAVMISLSAYILSMGMVCWAAISDFVDTSEINGPVRRDTYAGIYAQGFATQGLPEGGVARGRNIGWGLCWLCIGAVLMTAAQVIIRVLIMGPNFDLKEAVLEKGNVAAAICEAGFQIGIGIVVSASISGPPSHFGYDLAGCLLMFGISLLMMMLWSKLFDLYTRDWDTWAEIARGNIAAGISQFTQLVCTCMLMASSITKTWELSTFFAWLVSGTVVRMVFRTVLDYCVIAPKFINPRYSWSDLQIDKLILRGNWGAALIVGWLQLSVTAIINSFLPDMCEGFTYSDGRNVGLMSFEERLAGKEFVKLIWKWDRLGAIAIIFGVFILARLPYDLRLRLHARLVNKKAPHSSPGIDPDLNFYLVEPRKHAVSISFAAYMFSVGNMMVGVFKDANNVTSFVDSENPESWGLLLVQVAVGYVMIVVALFWSDFAILHKFNNVALMTQYDNRAVALVEAGSLIGSSFIIAAAINGWQVSDPPYGSAIIFFIASQLLFFVFQLIFEAMTKYDDEKEVQLGNAACGLNNGLNLIAVGMLLGRSTYVSHSLVMLVCWALVTFPLIFFFRLITDLIVLPNINLEATIECLDRLRPDIWVPARPCKQGNWGTALVAGTVTISLAQLLNTFLRDCPFNMGIPGFA